MGSSLQEKEQGVFIHAKYWKAFSNHVTAIVASQIHYWYLPDRQGKTKLKVQKEGHWWIKKDHKEWERETGLTRRQVQWALKELRDRGVIETKIFKFGGVPSIHLRAIAVNDPRPVLKLHDSIAHPCAIQCTPMCKPLHTDVQSITDTTNKDYGQKLEALASPPGTQEITPEEGEISGEKEKPQGDKKVTSANELLGKWKDGTLSGKVLPPGNDHNGILQTWREVVPKHFDGLVGVFTMKEVAMAKRWAKAWGPDTLKVATTILSDWVGFVKYVKQEAGLHTVPYRPSVLFINKYVTMAQNFAMANFQPVAQFHGTPSAVNCTVPKKPTGVVIKKKPAATKPKQVPVKEEKGITLQELLDLSNE